MKGSFTVDELKINLSDQQEDLHIDMNLAQEIVKTFLEIYQIHCNELSVFFVSAEEICTLHQDFFNDPSLTDCISFPIDLEMEANDIYRVLGDIFVCPYTAIEYATLNGGDPFFETTLYLVHGLLHLIGYDDTTDELAAQMRQEEQKVLTCLKERGLMLKDRPEPLKSFS